MNKIHATMLDQVNRQKLYRPHTVMDNFCDVIVFMGVVAIIGIFLHV